METVNSMIKRRLGPALQAQCYWDQCHEIILRVITHIVMVGIRIRVFYRTGSARSGLRAGSSRRSTVVKGGRAEAASRVESCEFVGCGGPLAFAINNSPLGGVVGGDLNGNTIAGDDPNEVLAHFAGNVGEHFMTAERPLLEGHHELCVG